MDVIDQPGQLSIFEVDPGVIPDVGKKLQVVNAEFINVANANWEELFDGFRELYAITFSAGIDFLAKVMDRFSHIEVIFGCEDVVSSDLAAVMAVETKTVELIAKSKRAPDIAKRIEEGSVLLRVSRDTRSHEKIFILRADDGRSRVITGSANMSASAFCGFQRENIVCFSSDDAFRYYKGRFDDFWSDCSDEISHKVIDALMADPSHIRDHADEIPIVGAVNLGKTVFLEQENYTDEAEIAADIRGLESEMKPMLPKSRKTDGRILLSKETVKSFARKHREYTEEKKIREKSLPKLHLDMETGSLRFNGQEMDLHPDREAVKRDLAVLENLMESFSIFYGDWEKSRKNYYSFLVWYFAGLFIPYLRYIASISNYDVTPFPVVGILYGESNGGKSAFLRLLSKLMCGIKVPENSGNDFTATNIENLKRACEGLPINIDDLGKVQFDNHYERVIKNDSWGLAEHFVNYPIVVISSNKLASIKPDVSKRVVACYISARLDKETAAKNSKKINKAIENAGTALFCEYVGRMLPEVRLMEERMRGNDQEYFPDIFEVSSSVMSGIFRDFDDHVPEWVTELRYEDYFGDKAVGRQAIDRIINAWKSEPGQFMINRKQNTLTYSYPEGGRLYELPYLQQELPPVLNPRIAARSITIDLEAAEKIMDMKFRKKLFLRR